MAPHVASNGLRGEAVRYVPIEIRLVVDDRTATFALVGDPADAMLAVNLGQSVATAILELADWIENAPPGMAPVERNDASPAPRMVAPPVEKPTEPSP